MPKTNYHTHTTRCMHASGTDEDFITHALEGGFTTLGYADHAPFPYQNGYVSRIRMPASELEGYIASINALRDRYEGQIEVLLGLECEYWPRYRDHILRMRDMGIEYYVLGQHYADSEECTTYTGLECVSDDGIKRYAEATCNAIRTGLYLYVAHPDLMMRHRTDEQWNAACEEAADAICQAAHEAHMPLEYNLAGLELQLNGKERGYPSKPFWNYVKKWNNPVILGVDAHEPEMLSNLHLWEVGRQNVMNMGFTLVDAMDIHHQ